MVGAGLSADGQRAFRAFFGPGSRTRRRHRTADGLSKRADAGEGGPLKAGGQRDPEVRALRERIGSLSAARAAHRRRAAADDWVPHAMRFFEHVRDLPGPLRVPDLQAYVRSLGFVIDLVTEEFDAADARFAAAAKAPVNDAQP